MWLSWKWTMLMSATQPRSPTSFSSAQTPQVGQSLPVAPVSGLWRGPCRPSSRRADQGSRQRRLCPALLQSIRDPRPRQRRYRQSSSRAGWDREAASFVCALPCSPIWRLLHHGARVRIRRPPAVVTLSGPVQVRSRPIGSARDRIVGDTCSFESPVCVRQGRARNTRRPPQ